MLISYNMTGPFMPRRGLDLGVAGSTSDTDATLEPGWGTRAGDDDSKFLFGNQAQTKKPWIHQDLTARLEKYRGFKPEPFQRSDVGHHARCNWPEAPRGNRT
jgi:hypothetical protein